MSTAFVNMKEEIDHILKEQDDRHESMEQDVDQIRAMVEHLQNVHIQTPEQKSGTKYFDIGTDPMRTVPQYNCRSGMGLCDLERALEQNRHRHLSPGVSSRKAQGSRGFPVSWAQCLRWLA